MEHNELLIDPVAIADDGPLGPLTVRIIAGSASSAALAAKVLAQHGARVVLAESTAGLADGDVLLVDESGALRLANEGRDLTDDAHWPTGVIRCAVTTRGLANLDCAPGRPEVIAQALSGLMDCTGHADGEPRLIGVPVASVAAAAIACGAIAALSIRRRTSSANLVADVSMLECGFSVLASTHLPVVLSAGQRPTRAGNRHPAFVPWNAYRATDGWVQVCGGGGWEAQARCFGLAHLLDDPEFADPQGRLRRGDELDAMVANWCAQRSVAGCVDEMTAAGLVGGPIADGDSVRGDGPGSPVRHGAALAPSPRFTGGGQPLSGVSVVEMGPHTAGPLTGRLLAALGATVIKVEPPRGDPARRLATRMNNGDGYLFELNNVDKTSVGIDPSIDSDRVRLAALIERSDIFLQSLTPGYVDSLDVVPAARTTLRCDISGYPSHGPRALDKAFDTVIQASTGIMSLTGDPATPLKAGGSVVDQVTAMFAAAGILLSVASPEPRDIEVSLEDVGLWLTAARASTGHDTQLSTTVQVRDGYIVVHDDDPTRIEPLLASATELDREDFVAQCRSLGVDATPVLGLDEASTLPELKELLLHVEDERREAVVLADSFGLRAGLTSTRRPAPPLARSDNDSSDPHREKEVSDVR